MRKLTKYLPQVIKVRDMYIVEENARALGISSLQMMEVAGKSIADVVAKYVGYGKKIVVVCGLGNNGGDGFVAARYLSCRGYDVSVALLGDPKDIRTDEARRNWSILQLMNYIEKVVIKEVDDLPVLKSLLVNADCVVDAILGIGVRGTVRGLYAKCIELINSIREERKIPIVSVDVPSGLSADTGEVLGQAVKATVTVTFHKVKEGLLKAKEYCGDVIVVDIGIPLEAELLVGPGDVRYALPRWSPYVKKGDRGRVLVIGGSVEYSGAPALTALAALSAGVDLVIVATPSSVANIVRSYSPNLIVRALPGDYISSKHVLTLLELINRVDVVAIGPGLTTVDEVHDAVTELMKYLKESRRYVVIDADGIKVLRERHDLLYEKAVVTPHAGEFRILTGQELPPPNKLEERCEVAIEWARKLGCTLLIKGPQDIVTDGKVLKINATGNQAMAVGGTGDVLTGLVAAFLCWSSPVTAAAAAAFINGLAGDLAVREMGSRITATDLLKYIPRVLRLFEVPSTSSYGAVVIDYLEKRQS